MRPVGRASAVTASSATRIGELREAGCRLAESRARGTTGTAHRSARHASPGNADERSRCDMQGSAVRCSADAGEGQWALRDPGQARRAARRTAQLATSTVASAVDGFTNGQHALCRRRAAVGSNTVYRGASEDAGDEFTFAVHGRVVLAPLDMISDGVGGCTAAGRSGVGQTVKEQTGELRSRAVSPWEWKRGR